MLCFISPTMPFLVVEGVVLPADLHYNKRKEQHTDHAQAAARARFHETAAGSYDRRFFMQERNMKRISDLMLVSVALIWGMGFPMTQMAIDAHISSGLMVALRFSLAAAVMGVAFHKQLRTITPRDALLGILAGCMLGVAFLLQIMGQGGTTPSNTAFLSSLNVIIVPFLGWALFRQRPTGKTLLVAFGCLVGAAVLTLSPEEGLRFSTGDLLVLAWAVAFSLHIAYLGRIAGLIEVQKLTFLQMATAAVLGIVYTLLFEREALPLADLRAGFLPVAYLGLFSSAYGFFAQTFAQKHTPPARAAIILGCEGVLGSTFSVLMGYEPLTVNLVAGGAIIFLSLLAMEVSPGALLRRRAPASPEA